MSPSTPRPSIATQANEPDVRHVDAVTRDFVLTAARYAGLALDDYHAAIMLECAPHALAMAERIRTPGA
jgi:hypothetical protein